MSDPQSTSANPLETQYDYREIQHVAVAFFQTIYTMRDVAVAARKLAARREFEKKNPISGMRWYRRRKRCWQCVPDLLPNRQHLCDRIQGARGAVESVWAALYVADHGPLFSPFNHLGIGPRTVFDRELDKWSKAAEPLIEAIPHEWGDEEFEAWDKLRPRERMAKAMPAQLAGVLLVGQLDILDPSFAVPEMWKVSKVANRLVEELGHAHHPLLEGSLLLARLGHVISESTDGERSGNPYPMADRFPRDFGQPSEWRQYASLVRKLNDIAPGVGVSDPRVADILTAAEHLADTWFNFAVGECDEQAIGKVAVHFDPVVFAQAYRRIRNSISDRLRKVIPDRGKTFAESFGTWAPGVSAEDASLAKVAAPPNRDTSTFILAGDVNVDLSKTTFVQQTTVENTFNPPAASPPPPSASPPKPALKTPSDQAIQAWRAVKFAGQTQIEVGNMLGVGQSAVSKWCAEVEAYIAAGNALPNIPQQLAAKPLSVDPAIIEKGQRETI